MKLFSSIFEGSLYGKFEPTVTFIAMLALAEKDGTIDMTPPAIAARCGFPLELIETGIRELEKPDPLSRTIDEEGRRIVLIHPERTWGWRIVNYVKYREIRSAEERREYMRQYKRKQRSTMSTGVHPSEAEAEAEAERLLELPSSGLFNPSSSLTTPRACGQNDLKVVVEGIKERTRIPK